MPTVCQVPCENDWACSRVIKKRFFLHIYYVIITYERRGLSAAQGILAVFMLHV